MTSTQRFIEDAIKGGHEYACRIQAQFIMEARNVNIEKLLLDPLAWQAVGRQRVWGHGRERLNWKNNWLAFVQFLADGKTIEAALSDIEGKV